MAGHPEVEAVLQSSLGAALVADGRPDAADEAFASAAAQGLLAGVAEVAVVALGRRALLAALRGELSRSSELAARALRLSSRCAPSQPALRRSAEVALVYVHVERYDLAAARRLDAPSSDLQDVPDEPLHPVVLALARARLLRADGDLARALEALSPAGRMVEVPGWLADLLRREQAALRAAEGQPPGRPDRPRPRPTGPAALLAPVDALVQSAFFHSSAGRVDGAVLDLERALRIAAPELSRRAFRQAPPELQALLAQHPALSGRHPWLVVGPVDDAGDCSGCSSPGPTPEAALPIQRHCSDPLPRAEVEVLRHLARRRTSEQIAAELGVPVDAVRRQIRRIVADLACATT